MADYNVLIQPKRADGTFDNVYPYSKAHIVSYDQSDGLNATDVQGAFAMTLRARNIQVTYNADGGEGGTEG